MLQHLSYFRIAILFQICFTATNKRYSNKLCKLSESNSIILNLFDERNILWEIPDKFFPAVR